MASFRRPKKPTRPRVVMMTADSEEEEGVEKMEVDSPPPPPREKEAKNGHGAGAGSKLSFGGGGDGDVEEIVSFKKKDKKDKGATLLSFDDDLDGEEAEVFQVKKSSVSRRLMKQRDKEKKDKKPEKKPKQSLGAGVQGFVSQMKAKEEPVVKVKDEPKEDKDFIRVLNGREAEALHMESDDEEEEEEVHIKFRRPGGGGAAIQDAVRRALEQGQIPDANLIHEARKRKQQAREMGGGSAVEFVPVDDTIRIRKEKGRLVREDDDNDQSDEERLDFSSATNAAKIDRDKRIEEFNAAQDEGSGQDSDGELDEWESQQIRKGVSQAKMHNVAKEMYEQGYMDSPSGPPAFFNNSPDASGGFSLYPASDNVKKKGKTQSFMEQTQKVASIEEVVSGSKKVSPELILKQMSERLDRLKISRDRNAGELSRVEADLKLAEKELDEATDAKADLNSRFIMYQNLRGYVTDLVDCLRCKVPEIERLENRLIDQFKARRDRFAERRRQDVRDQMEEVSATNNIMGGAPVTKPPPSNPERTRRAAEREGRRTRRRRLREKELADAKSHKDGLSSDDEETEIEFKAFYASRENIIGESSSIFEDVHEDFGTLGGILSRFEEWRENDFDSYKDSFAFMCLPKCVAPLIRLQLLSWDPLRDGCDFFKHSWMKALLSYSFRSSETIENLTTDPDSRMIPSVIEKVVLPWLSRVIEARWDPMSGSQTRGLVNVINRLIEDYSISPNSKPMHAVMETAVTRIKDALENDVYVPIYAKTAIPNSFTPASVFLSRQFWSSVKLLDNMSKWQGLLSDRPLQAMALDSLLVRYSLLGLRVATDLGESVDRAKGVVNVLPRAWLTRENETPVPNGLLQLSRCLVSLTSSADCTVAANRLAVPDVSNILKTIGSNDEAQLILRKYS